MKLGQWVQAWRSGHSAAEPSPEPPAPLAALLTDTAATLRHVLEHLPDSPPDGATEGADGSGTLLERALATVERYGAALGSPPLEHAAGQMRAVWRSVADGTLALDSTTLAAMRSCTGFLLHQITDRRHVPKDAPELETWQRAYRNAMLRQRPSSAPPRPAHEYAAADEPEAVEAELVPAAPGGWADEFPAAEVEVEADAAEPGQEESAADDAAEERPARDPLPALEMLRPRNAAAGTWRPAGALLPEPRAPRPDAMNADELERQLLALAAPRSA